MFTKLTRFDTINLYEFSVEDNVSNQQLHGANDNILEGAGISALNKVDGKE